VVGGGTMGTGIAMNFLNAGIPVTLLETSAALCAAAEARVRSTYEVGGGGYNNIICTLLRLDDYNDNE
jgi:3-hydroxyacyl-CoA dehydrogenase